VQVVGCLTLCTPEVPNHNEVTSHIASYREYETHPYKLHVKKTTSVIFKSHTSTMSVPKGYLHYTRCSRKRGIEL